MGDKMTKSDREWRESLSDEQYRIARLKGTEPAFTGLYYDCKEKGVYRCVCCGNALFKSDSKYDSGSGWPSFWEPIDEERVKTVIDTSHGMVRTEVTCAGCDAHLGHVFGDGPRPTGKRYCINSAVLDLKAEETD